MTDQAQNQCQGCQAGWPMIEHKPWPSGSPSMYFHSVVGGYAGQKYFCTAGDYRDESLIAAPEMLVDCPQCKSTDIELEWKTPEGIPEYQGGTCNDCDETWNQCAR